MLYLHKIRYKLIPLIHGNRITRFGATLFIKKKITTRTRRRTSCSPNLLKNHSYKRGCSVYFKYNLKICIFYKKIQIKFGCFQKRNLQEVETFWISSLTLALKFAQTEVPFVIQAIFQFSFSYF